MVHGLLITLHLFCAAVFIGIVCFEVLILEGIRAHLPAQHMRLVEEGIHRRGRQLMPWFVGALFLSGIGMASITYRGVLAAQWGGTGGTVMGLLLSVKILLALSVLVHFLLAMRHAICGNMSSRRFKYTHLSVFVHMILIVVLAKAMHYLGGA